jgi:HEAT repeat protein
MRRKREETEPLVPEFIKVLEHEDTGLRQKAVIALGEIRTEEGYKALLGMLNDSAPEVRVEAINSLVEFGRTEVIPGFAKLYEDKDSSVRRAAVEAIARTGGKDAVDFLIPALKNDDPTVVIIALEALGRLKAKKAAPHIIPLLEHENASVRVAAARALGLIGEPSAAKALIKLLNDENDDVRKAAVPPMIAIGPADLADHLMPLLDDPDYEIRLLALDALIEMKVDTEAFREKLRYIAGNDTHTRLRKKARQVLAQMEKSASRRSERKKALDFGWEVGDWWEIKYCRKRWAFKVQEDDNESEYRSFWIAEDLYFEVITQSTYKGKSCFGVSISTGTRDDIKKGNQQFGGLALLYVRDSDYSAVEIEYSDRAKSCFLQGVTQESLNKEFADRGVFQLWGGSWYGDGPAYLLVYVNSVVGGTSREQLVTYKGKYTEKTFRFYVDNTLPWIKRQQRATSREQETESFAVLSRTSRHGELLLEFKIQNKSLPADEVLKVDFEIKSDKRLLYGLLRGGNSKPDVIILMTLRKAEQQTLGLDDFLPKPDDMKGWSFSLYGAFSGPDCLRHIAGARYAEMKAVLESHGLGLDRK